MVQLHFTTQGQDFCPHTVSEPRSTAAAVTALQCGCLPRSASVCPCRCPLRPARLPWHPAGDYIGTWGCDERENSVQAQ